MNGSWLRAGLGALAMGVLCLGGSAPAALAQDGSGVQATKEGAQTFLGEALVRPGIATVVKPARYAWLHATKNRCEAGLSNHRGGCVWIFEVSRMTHDDCQTNVFLRLLSEPDTDMKPEDRGVKPGELNDNLGFTVDWRTVQVSTYFDNTTQANAISLNALPTPWRTYFHPNFNIRLKDGSTDRVVRAMQFLQNACQLRSDTGF